MVGKSSSYGKINYQVKGALGKITFIGQSKKAFRDAGKETGIHSLNQLRHAESDCQNFIKWAHEHEKLKSIYDLKRAHYRAYMDYMKTKGVSNGHLINIETDLRLLNKGMQRISAEKHMQSRDWVPKTRLIDPETRERPKDRSMTSEQIQKVQEKLSARCQAAATFQQAFGLRLREAAGTRRAHVIEKGGRLFWQAIKDKAAINTAQGVTKAGRERVAPCHPDLEPAVRELIAGKKPAELLCPRYNTLKAAYNRAGMKGSHAFRHTYARDMLRQELRSKGVEAEGKQLIDKMLENRANGHRKDFGLHRNQLYQKTCAAVDRVHAYLGHGKGRIDLCEVYMKGV